MLILELIFNIKVYDPDIPVAKLPYPIIVILFEYDKSLFVVTKKGSFVSLFNLWNVYCLEVSNSKLFILLLL